MGDEQTKEVKTPVDLETQTEGKKGEGDTKPDPKTQETKPAESKKDAEAKKVEGEKTEAKKDESKKEELKPEDKKESEKKEEPKFELKLPKDSKLTPAHVDKIVAYAKENKLSPEVAQKMLERESNLMADFQKDTVAHLTEKVNVEWPNQARADKEIGGENFEKNVEFAKRAIDKFGSPDFRKTLDETGLGNHPELLRTFVRVGKMLTNDEFVSGKNDKEPEEKSHAAALYPNLPRAKAR